MVIGKLVGLSIIVLLWRCGGHFHRNIQHPFIRVIYLEMKNFFLKLVDILTVTKPREKKFVIILVVPIKR